MLIDDKVTSFSLLLQTSPKTKREKKICIFQIYYLSLHSQNRNVYKNILVPWMSGLVSGLQNRVRRFESARTLGRLIVSFTIINIRNIRMVPWMSGLVSGLQNHVRQFESARHLSKNKIGTTLVLQLKNRLYYFIGDRVYFCFSSSQYQ